MNIFALDAQPKLAAQYHCDKHVVKMILESCQLLSTAHRVLNGTMVVEKSKTGRNVKRYKLHDPVAESLLYSATHINHPSAVWCRSHLDQYNWLALLTYELCKEYTHRYGKIHKCEQTGMVQWFLNNAPKNIHAHFNWTLPTPAMDKIYLIHNSNYTLNVVESYRNYYVKAKSHLADWSGKINGRPTPLWYLEKVC